MVKELIIFDLNGTLTESKFEISTDVAYLFSILTRKYKVAIASGARYEQFHEQVIDKLYGPELRNLYLITTNGAKNYWYNGKLWNTLYPSFEFKPQEVISIVRAIQKASILFPWMNIIKAEQYGPQIENRYSQITFSALGQRAPVEAKKDFDPNQEKRKALREYLLEELSDYDIKIGGMTSIDVTGKGIDKVFGIRQIMRLLNIEKDNVLYIGDAFYEGGNDHCVKKAGFECIEVRNLLNTKMIIGKLIRDDDTHS